MLDGKKWVCWGEWKERGLVLFARWWQAHVPPPRNDPGAAPAVGADLLPLARPDQQTVPALNMEDMPAVQPEDPFPGSEVITADGARFICAIEINNGRLRALLRR